MRERSQHLLATTLAAALIASAAPAEAAPEVKVLGDPAAPVEIREYSSLSCPACGAWHTEILPFVKETYIDTGKARLVYRDVIGDAPTLMAATLAHCSGDRFFDFLEVLYENQSSWATAPSPAAARAQLEATGLPERFAAAGGSADEVEFLYEIAGPLNRLIGIGRLGGMSQDEILACFTDFELQSWVAEDARPEFETYGVTGTPTIVVDGETVGRGVPTREEIAETIDAALAD